MTMKKITKRNESNRKKCITVAFRVTPKERDELNKRIYLSGRTKQDYMLQSALEQSLIIVGNQHLYRRIIERLKDLEPLLHNIANGNSENEAVMAELRMIYEITETWE